MMPVGRLFMDPVSSIVRTRIIEDVDAMAAAVADGLHAEYVQLEAKRFSASWTIVTLPDLVLQFVLEDVAVVRRIRVPPGRYAFVVPLAVPESARWNARPVNGNEVIVCGPRSETYACDPAGTMFAIVTVSKSSAIAGLGARLAKGGTADCTVVPRVRDARELQRRLAAVAETGAVSQTVDLRGVRTGIGTALEICLRNAMPGERQVEAAAC